MVLGKRCLTPQHLMSTNTDIWLEYTTDGGESYYYNPETKKSVWERPVDMHMYVVGSSLLLCRQW